MKQALEEAKMSVKDTRKLEKEFENAWESASGGKAFRSKVVGQQTRDLIQEQRHLGHCRSEAEVRVGIFGPPRTEIGRQTRNRL